MRAKHVDPPALFHMRGGVYTREGVCDKAAAAWILTPAGRVVHSQRGAADSQATNREYTSIGQLTPPLFWETKGGFPGRPIRMAGLLRRQVILAACSDARAWLR
jgi:hypothetical protein